MNFLRSKILAAFMLLIFGGQAFGFTWSFTNATDKLMLVQVVFMSKYNPETGLGVYFNIVQPGETRDFSYPLPQASFNNLVKIAEFDWNIQGKNLEMQYKMMPASQRRDLFSKLVDNREQQKNMLKHPLKNAEVKFLPESTWNFVNSKIESAVKKITDGSAKTMGEALRLVGYDAGSFAEIKSYSSFNPMKWLIQGLSYHFNIVEDKGIQILITKDHLQR